MEREGWLKYLSDDVHTRLGNCCSCKEDIPLLVNAKWRYYKEIGKDKKGFTKEDALIAVLELLDCNGQNVDLTRDEYNELKKE